MIGQYLSNTNENTIVSIFQNFLELNKAWYSFMTKRYNGALHLTGEWGLPRHVVKFVHSGLLVVTTIHAMEIYVKLHSTVYQCD